MGWPVVHELQLREWHRNCIFGANAFRRAQAYRRRLRGIPHVHLTAYGSRGLDPFSLEVLEGKGNAGEAG